MDASRSGASADSYIGSLISLTSKFEIRYEGVLYNINTEESSIGLRNVRSFGTEGRKKDGPQIPASDKIYEYILFRGSDIKDLQVKSSPPVQNVYNDPAIIQSHYSHPTSIPSSLPSVGSGTGTVADPSSHTGQLGLLRPTFQGGLPLHQAGGSLGSWGSTPLPPTQNGPGLTMPLYWQGYFTSASGLPHLQQPPLFRPPPGLPLPHSMQPFQYPGINPSLLSGPSNLPEFPPMSQPTSSTPISMYPTLAPIQASSSVPDTTPSLPYKPATISQLASSTPNLMYPMVASTLSPIQASSSAPDMTPSLPYKTPASSPATTLGPNHSTTPPLTSSSDSIATLSQNLPSIITSKPTTVPAPFMAFQTTSKSIPSTAGFSSKSHVETSVPLVTPGQLMQPSVSTLSSSQPLQTSLRAVEVKQPEAKSKAQLPELLVSAPAEANEPILPLPTPANHRPYGVALQTHHSSGGYVRGRGNGYQQHTNKFAEDFDFTAMNEKFNKDEVWGHLGKNKAQPADEEDEFNEALDDYYNAEPSNPEIKPVYVKDDFFDTLSSNALDRGSHNGRIRFSEQMKIDTETFGEFQRNRLGGRGGGRGFRGGRTRGGSTYNGRGYDGYGGRGYDGFGGRGYGFYGRGRGRAN